MIKLADRLHNMRTLKYKTPESQQRIAKETLEIYCPIAQRLGISKLKIELDDLSLKHVGDIVTHLIFQCLIDQFFYIDVNKNISQITKGQIFGLFDLADHK